MQGQGGELSDFELIQDTLPIAKLFDESMSSIGTKSHYDPHPTEVCVMLEHGPNGNIQSTSQE